MHPHPTMRQLIHHFTNRRLTCEAVITESLARAKRAAAVLIHVDDEVLTQAKQIDRARMHGEALPALAGIPLTVKDLFNIQGQRTLAGSVVLKHEAAVEKVDAEVVGRLRAAGALLVGRANMSEFAFSGLGLNPHYGNPQSIWDRATGRLPGGSSSGSAVSVAEGIAPASLGSDTAGSCRIPAAFNGIVGVKPSFGRLSLRGVYPLSKSSDAPGALANDVDGCFLLDYMMRGRWQAGAPLPTLPPRDVKSVRLCVPQAVVMKHLQPQVASDFARALQWLQQAGVTIVRRQFAVLDSCVEMFDKRAVAVFEAWLAHGERLQQHGDEYDPFVRRRIVSGQHVTAAQRQQRYAEKAALVATFQQQSRAAKVDALVYPTVQCLPPAIRETHACKRMSEINFTCLRNTCTVNYFDGCAITLPCHAPQQAPVGLMLAAGHGEDDSLYEIAAAVEVVLNRRRVEL